jgi:Protein kinase domain
VSDQVPEGFSAGSLVAGYRLEERIGEGGMATVFRAYDGRLGRYVALKILAPGLASDETFRQRFVRESRAAAGVDEPHIVPVFEAGESGGVLFIAMRYVRGGDVRSLIRGSGPLPAVRVADIVAQAAAALDAAHAHGLVHRDVKPANMLLESSGAGAGGADHVYLSDFGLSKGALAATDLTDRGQFLGTLDYAAPEQIEARPLDGRSDEYALACSAFEMLYGEPPFRREQGVAVMYAHLSEEPPLVRSRRPELSAAVDDVLATGMAKRPGNRYGSCGEFATALGRALGAEGSRPDAPRAGQWDSGIALPVTSGPSGETQHLTKDGVRLSRDGVQRPWWRSPAGLAGICAAGLVLAGGGYVLADGGHAHGDGGPAHGDGGSARTATGLALPDCTTATAKVKDLTGVHTATTKLGGAPFGVAVTPSARYSFVTTGNSVALVRDGPGLAPKFVRAISVHGAGKGIAVTANGRYAIAAAGNGAAVINVAEAEHGLAHPVAGFLASPTGSGAVEVLISPNDRFVFVTLQNSAEMAVFSLKAAITGDFGRSDFVGYVPLAAQPVGMTTDGKWLYVVSLTGKLTVLNLREAEIDPAHSVVTAVPDGCGSARASFSGNGKVIWVTARQSDALLAFSAAKLRTDPAHALVARVEVGEKPLGETLIDHGTKILVADSNLNHLPGVLSNLAVVSTAKALSGKQALLGYLPVGPVLRQFAVEPGGHVVLVTVQGAGRLEAVNIDGLP